MISYSNYSVFLGLSVIQGPWVEAAAQGPQVEATACSGRAILGHLGNIGGGGKV